MRMIYPSKDYLQILSQRKNGKRKYARYFAVHLEDAKMRKRTFRGHTTSQAPEDCPAQMFRGRGCSAVWGTTEGEEDLARVENGMSMNMSLACFMSFFSFGA
jgi:hypothetical protein